MDRLFALTITQRIAKGFLRRGAADSGQIRSSYLALIDCIQRVSTHRSLNTMEVEPGFQICSMASTWLEFA